MTKRNRVVAPPWSPRRHGFALQQIQQWTGILAIATWAGKLFDLAGCAPEKSAWLADLLNTFGIFGTAAAALVIDRYGRRASLLISFTIQGISLFLVAALIKTSEDNQTSDQTKASELGTAAASFLFVFLWFFTIFNIVPCLIYGTEIWPQEGRAKEYSFTILGWAIGCGMTTFVILILLQHLGWATFVFFGALNIIASPIVYFFYPETANRSLEEMNLIFTSESWLVSENMKEYHRRVEAAGGHIAVAARALLGEVNGETHLDPRRIVTADETGEKGDRFISSVHDEIHEKV
ncbi:putative MFS sugar transporter [Rhexocercosporidium sp. MPI-PUGE-AT-0058]|nr:putative MFS sugar transporter [Rhexocercosporidium sp. MPI-PUGE-AT-0058]